MQLDLNLENPVFLDETCAKTNMTRLHGRALKGKRLVDKTPHGHWVNTTHGCALRRDGVVAPHAFVGAMNKVKLIAYVRDVLCPTRHQGDIVICDKLSAHKNVKAKTLPCLVEKKVRAIALWRMRGRGVLLRQTKRFRSGLSRPSPSFV